MTRKTIIILVFSVLLAGCTSTRIVNEWHDERYAGKQLTSFFVLSISQKASERRFYESAFTTTLIASGLKATPSYEVLEDDVLSEDVKLIDRAVAIAETDAILTTRVIEVIKQTRYEPPPMFSFHSGHYHDHHFHDHFHSMFHFMMYQPVERTDTIVVLETNIYEAQSGRLLWTGTSRSFNPSSVESIVAELAKQMIRKLAGHGLVRALATQ